MCLFKVKQEEDVVVPYRVHRPRSPSPRRRSTQRVSRTEVIRESRPQSSTYIVPAPTHYPQIPAPQPVPVFVQPPPPPPASSHGGRGSQRGGPHYVEVSPRSSVTSHSDYVISEREVRRERRDHSPARSSAYGDRSPTYETYRYVDPPPRERSRSRDRRSYADSGTYRETRERVLIVDDDGRRRREYRR